MEFSNYRFEQQQAKITISKLKCEAYEDQSLQTIVGKLNETVVKLEKATFSAPIRCPTENSYYRYKGSKRHYISGN